MFPKTEPDMSSRPPPLSYNPHHAPINGSVDGPSEFSASRSSGYLQPAPHSSKHSEFTLEERSRLDNDLRKYLAPEFTATRSGPGRSTLTYVEGWRIKNLANSLFGFDGWSSTITDVTVDFLDVDADGKVYVGVSVMVKVVLKDGTFHEDIGYGSSENQKSKASSFEKAKKEATTDGLKRALTSFGNLLGTCLYDKNYCKHLSMQRVNKPKFDSKDYYYPPETHLQQLPRRAPLQQQQQQQQQQPPVNGNMAAFQSVTNPSSTAPYNNAASRANSHAESSNPMHGSIVSGQYRPSTSTTATTITPAPVSTASFHQPKQTTVVKGEQELDDEFFGPDLEEPRASQPESPRMSEFDFKMDDMMADDSPIKDRVPGAAIGNVAASSGTELPATPRRTSSFTRSASSPSVVQTTPTKNATAAQRFQGQALAPVPFKNPPMTSSSSGSIPLKVADADNPFLIKLPAAPASSSSAASLQPNQGQSRLANPAPNPYAPKLPLQQHWSKKDTGSSAIQRPTGSGHSGANDPSSNGSVHGRSTSTTPSPSTTVQSRAVAPPHRPTTPSLASFAQPATSVAIKQGQSLGIKRPLH
ncbi:DNA repair protein rad52 [Mortierella alpina]|nr:DNA repair protein rad52 [Mortierella alpina]